MWFGQQPLVTSLISTEFNIISQKKKNTLYFNIFVVCELEALWVVNWFMEGGSEKKTVKDCRSKRFKSGFFKKKAAHQTICQRGNFNIRKPKMLMGQPLKDKMQLEKLKEMKYSRGDPIGNYNNKIMGSKRKCEQKEKNVTYALEQSVKTELLLTEDPGFMEVEEGKASEITQLDILNVVDACSAAKRFDLILETYGPYRMKYTRNGRHLLLGSERGHVAALDWVSKRLLCEINVKESVHDIAWLHQETLFATAQKKWLYIYDNQGIEIHCVKQISDIMKLEFLPYHYLLSAVSSNGWLSWLDVTVGAIVEQLRIGPLSNPATVAQHPGNALICIGQPSGLIHFWSPNSKRPAVTKWCHRQPICALGFDPRGEVLATASVDRMIKLWDARNLKGPTKHYRLNSAPNWISFSESGLMALALGNNIEIYQDNTVGSEIQKKLYLTYQATSKIRNMEFCPCEDVLGAAHSMGFSSILVPGSGQPNFDALEINPFQTKSQRRESEVQGVLTKIPPHLITWDPNELRKVHVSSLEDEIEGRKKTGYIKPPMIIIEPRYKVGKNSRSRDAVRRKNNKHGKLRWDEITSLKEPGDAGEGATEKEMKTGKKYSVLDRFKRKTTK